MSSFKREDYLQCYELCRLVYANAAQRCEDRARRDRSIELEISNQGNIARGLAIKIEDAIGQPQGNPLPAKFWSKLP